MKFRFHPEAIDEYQDHANWYAQREPDLELRFIEAVEDAIRRIIDAPERYRAVEEDVRRCLTHIFPYAILYTIETDSVLIVAVMHCSQMPGYWKTRLVT